MSESDDPSAASTLRLTDALHLLTHGGVALPESLDTSTVAGLQAVIDGLCALSSRDALTGLVNRRQFLLSLDRELDRVARAGEPALMLVIDIDHFKVVNDTHGHNAGDLVIAAVGQTLAECVRPMDTVARLGGEEFAAVLPNCPPTFGFKVAERVRQRIAARMVDIGLGRSLSVTVSIGGAFAPQWVRSSPKIWTERADQQLYRAKHEGRNRVCLENVPVSVVTAEEKGLLFALTPAPIRHV